MPQPNSRIGDYITQRLLGRGPLSEVWLGRHYIRTTQAVAIKLPVTNQYIDRLRATTITYAARTLAHPNIVANVAIEVAGDPPYIVSDYCPGGSARALAAARSLAHYEAVVVVRQVLLGLKHAHGRGIFHGDLKPDNVLLDDRAADSRYMAEGSVKISDFVTGPIALASLLSIGRGQDTTALAYAAPELRGNTGPDALSDLFSMGVILFELLTGERPAGSDVPSELNPRTPVSLDAVFRRACARRERRFTSADDFIDALDRLEIAAVGPPGSGYSDASNLGKTEPSAVSRVESPPISRVEPPPVRRVEPPTERPAAQRDAIEIQLRAEDAREVYDFADDGSRITTGEIPLVGEVSQHPPAKPTAPPPKNQDEPAGIEVKFQPRDGGVLADLESPDVSPDGSTVISPAQPPGVAAIDRTAASMPESPAMNPVKPPAVSIVEPPAVSIVEPMPQRWAPGTLVDELLRRPIRSGDDIRNVMRGYFEERQLDQAEAANVRVRLGHWAHSIGGDADFINHIEFRRAVETPCFKLTFRAYVATGGSTGLTAGGSTGLTAGGSTGLTAGGSTDPAAGGSTGTDWQVLDTERILPSSRASVDCSDALGEADFKTIAHLSSDHFTASQFTAAIDPNLELAIQELLATATLNLSCRPPLREDLIVARANVLSVSVLYGGETYALCLVGNSLSVVAPVLPFRKGKPEVLRRAATLLDAGQAAAGLRDLRQCLEPGGPTDRAELLLSTLRAKLARSYVALAGEMASGFNWLESLDMSARAEALTPGDPEPLAHLLKIRRRVAIMNLLPAFIIAGIFATLGLISRPISFAFLAAALAALVSGMVAAKKLSIRVGRTYVAFLHAVLLPTALAGVLAVAPPRLDSLKGDLICAAVLILFIVADVVMLRRLRDEIFRPPFVDPIGNDPAIALFRIESYLAEDWDSLWPHYQALGTLSVFARRRGESDDE
jgi:serine/threonine protein kinase